MREKAIKRFSECMPLIWGVHADCWFVLMVVERLQSVFCRLFTLAYDVSLVSKPDLHVYF